MATQRTVRKELTDVKQPEDHKSTLKDASVEFNGETFTVKGRLLKDYEIIMWLGEVETNMMIFPMILKKLLGREDHARFMEAARDEDGVIDIDVVKEFFQNVMEEAKAKNS